MKADYQKEIKPLCLKTVAACSTGFPGAIAVIRLSGDKTKALLNGCFFSKAEIAPRLLRTGKINAGGISDTATAVFFTAPDSYTGEDMAEISVHANPLIVQKILMFLIKNGAEGAQKGEFTYRAFLNGKMDLSAAEAVSDIISAESEAEIKYAYRQMKGELRQKIDGLQNAITEALAEINAAIDFPEENIEDSTAQQAKKGLDVIKTELSKLIESYESGKFIKDGVAVAIIGGVNVGKSSLLNALLKKDRAIVTDVAGTTRDTLEDRFEYNGQKFIITDTAGIRESKDKIEAEGIARSKAAANKSDVIIAVTEAGRPFDGQTAELLETLKQDGKRIIFVENKTDIFAALLQNSIAVSAKAKQNIDALKTELYKITAAKAQTGANGGGETATADEAIIITELRHYQALTLAADCLVQAENAIKEGFSSELIALDFMYAYDFLGQITGKTGAEGIIETIFSRFCVGK